MQFLIGATWPGPYNAGGVAEACLDSGADIVCFTTAAAVLQSRQILHHVLPMHPL